MGRVNVGATIALVAAIATGGCDGEPLFGSEFNQGIDGVALIGPQCPVQTLNDPCPDLPHEARIDVLDDGGRLVVSLRSDAMGSFRVGLRAGDYILRPEAGNPFPTVDNQAVTVNPDEYADVVISFDTGIR